MERFLTEIAQEADATLLKNLGIKASLEEVIELLRTSYRLESIAN